VLIYTFMCVHTDGVTDLVWFEPTCIRKSTKPLDMLQDLPGAIQVATPNLQELRNMHQCVS